MYFFYSVCVKPHANPTIIYENIEEIHILAVGGNLEFPILSHVLLRRAPVRIDLNVYIDLIKVISYTQLCGSPTPRSRYNKRKEKEESFHIITINIVPVYM